MSYHHCRCYASTALRDNHRHRFRIQSAEFMRASQLDTRPVLFHGNVITRGAGSRGYEPRLSVYNRGLIRLTGCPSNRRQRGQGYPCGQKPRWDVASSIIEPRPFTAKYGNCARSFYGGMPIWTISRGGYNWEGVGLKGWAGGSRLWRNLRHPVDGAGRVPLEDRLVR